MNFNEAEPFPHVVLKNVVPPDLLRAAAAQFDSIPGDSWVQYDSPGEKGKRTFNRMAEMPPACHSLLSWMTSDDAVAQCEGITGMTNLKADPSLYGGGLHETRSGGFLGLHLDNEQHPRTGLIRRLNLLIFANEGWRNEWGGAFEMWDRRRTRPVVEVLPRFGTAVLFETSSHSYHGQTKPATCPPDVTRKSFCAFFWSEARARARFVGRSGESFIGESWRRERAENQVEMICSVCGRHWKHRWYWHTCPDYARDSVN